MATLFHAYRACAGHARTPLNMEDWELAQPPLPEAHDPHDDEEWHSVPEL